MENTNKDFQSSLVGKANGNGSRNSKNPDHLLAVVTIVIKHNLKVRLEHHSLHLMVEITSGSSNGITVNAGKSGAPTVIVPLPQSSAGGVNPIGTPPGRK